MKNTPHKTKQPEYYPWQNMKARCYYPRTPSYPNYGGRGITVCDAWRNDFWQFVEDMGPRPSPEHSIDRIDSDGPYCKENCRWATIDEQQENKRQRKDANIIEFRGRSQSITDWARELGMTVANIRSRLKLGWSTDRALGTPIRKHTWR